MRKVLRKISSDTIVRCFKKIKKGGGCQQLSMKQFLPNRKKSPLGTNEGSRTAATRLRGVSPGRAYLGEPASPAASSSSSPSAAFFRSSGPRASQRQSRESEPPRRTAAHVGNTRAAGSLGAGAEQRKHQGGRGSAARLRPGAGRRWPTCHPRLCAEAGVALGRKRLPRLGAADRLVGWVPLRSRFSMA